MLKPKPDTVVLLWCYLIGVAMLSGLVLTSTYAPDWLEVVTLVVLLSFVGTFGWAIWRWLQIDKAAERRRPK